MGYAETYAEVKAARGAYAAWLTLPDALAAPPWPGAPASPDALACAAAVRERCEMMLVRAYSDWYAGRVEVNISRAVHTHCERLAAGTATDALRRAGALLALSYAVLDADQGEAWVLLEHALPDMVSGAGDVGVPVRWVRWLEDIVTRWRTARRLPGSLARLERARQTLWLEILRWEVPPRSSWEDVRGRMDRGMEGIGKLVPPAVATLVEEAIGRGMRAGFDAAQAMAGFGSIRTAIRARGYTVDSPLDLRDVPLEELTDEAVSTVRWACGESALLGAATGAVGLPGLVADLPALMTLNLRLLARMSLLHGFDVAEPGERQFALNLLGASSSDGAARAVFLTNLNGLSVDLAHHKTRDEVSQHVLVGLVRQLARVVGARLTKRGLARAVPVLGGAVGAGVNYAFTAQTARAAMMVFRKRWMIAHCL